MAGKRGAISEMNHDNWDQEEESEDAGVFRTASANVMKNRVIRKAKRKGLAGASDETGEEKPAAPVFKGFSGFTSSNTKSTFSFNTDTSKPLGGFSNGGGAPTFSLTAGTAFGSFKPAVPATQPEAEKKTSETTTVNGSNSSSRTKYLQQLKALNESVAKWISEHVSKNAHCVLTPIFKDYDKHLAEVEKLNPDNQGKSGSSTTSGMSSMAGSEKKDSSETEKSSPLKSPTDANPPAFSFSSGTSASDDKKTSLFGAPSTASSTTVPSIFGAGSSATSLFGSSGFSFKPSGSTGTELKPFSFASSSTGASASKPDEVAEEEYEPPKVETTEIKEDDAFYSKKCKLYFQKSGAWTERGVGFVHLKPCGDKTQLLIRADTNLGNILMNIMLSSSIPLARQGKNNVSMMCMANPPIDPKEKDPKPTSFLIRVKTGDEADELLAELKKCQK